MFILYAYKLFLKFSSEYIHPNFLFYCFVCCHRVCPNLLSAPCRLILRPTLLMFLDSDRDLQKCLHNVHIPQVSNMEQEQLPRNSFRRLLLGHKDTVFALSSLIHSHSLLVHCNENPIYVFLLWELCGLSPNFYIYVSVSDLYIPRIGPHIWLQQNRPTDPGNI